MIGELNKQTELKNSILSLLNRDVNDEYGYVVDIIGLMEILKDFYGSRFLTDTLDEIEKYELKSELNNY